MSTTLGNPACSRSSTVHVVLAPVAAFVTLSTVPNGSVGLAHIPAGAAAYLVAWPCSPLDGAAAGAWVAGVTVGTTAARAETSSTGGAVVGVVVVVVEAGTDGGGVVTVVGVGVVVGVVVAAAVVVVAAW
jgi:hypothetical protein